ncbi:MAG: MATE family efflux transporter [Eubacteriales bacterium]
MPQNKMATMPVNKLLINVALPIIISMTIQGLYNVVDSIFVAKINENALNAISLAFPVQNTMIAVAVGISLGMNAVLSKSLGERKEKKATDTAMNGLFITMIASIITMAFGLWGVKPFFADQTNITEILSYGEEYLFICCFFSISLYFTITTERTLQATGRTMYTMMSQGIGAVVNIILDPILIFGLLGMPRMEVQGAAYATIIGQTTSLVLNIYFNWKHNPELKFQFIGFRPQWHIDKEILAIALPSMAMGTSASVLVFQLNKILLGFSATATAVLGVYFKLQSFVFMPVYGLTNGMIPILAFNYGAKEPKRFLQTLYLSLGYASAIMVLGTLLFQCFPEWLIRLFMEEGAGEEMLLLGVPAVKIISYCFPASGICIILSCMFQAVGKGMTSLLCTVARQLVIHLPCAYFFSQCYGINAVWYSFVLAETLAMIFVSILAFRIYRNTVTS